MEALVARFLAVVLCEPRTEHAKPNAPEVRTFTTDLDPVMQERNALATEVEVLHAKLEASEQQAKSLGSSFERTQHQLTDSIASVRSLTDEVKGLTAMVHAHKALPSPVGWVRSFVRQVATFRL